MRRAHIRESRLACANGRILTRAICGIAKAAMAPLGLPYTARACVSSTHLILKSGGLPGVLNATNLKVNQSFKTENVVALTVENVFRLEGRRKIVDLDNMSQIFIMTFEGQV